MAKMNVDKSKLKEPPNTEENREKLAEIIVHDMSIKEMKERIRSQLINEYKASKRAFLKEYWTYYEETWGHCPFGVNGD